MYYKSEDLVRGDYVAYRGAWWKVTFGPDDDELVLTRGGTAEFETWSDVESEDLLWRVATDGERIHARAVDKILHDDWLAAQDRLADQQASDRAQEALAAAREMASTQVAQTLVRLSAAGHPGRVVEPSGTYCVGRIELEAGPAIMFYTTGKAALGGKRVPEHASEVKEQLRASGWQVKP